MEIVTTNGHRILAILNLLMDKKIVTKEEIDEYIEEVKDELERN